MSPPQHDRVVADCDDALRQDPNYVKALNRRATALESLDRYEEALRGLRLFQIYPYRTQFLFADFTAATILEKFQNETAAQAVERVLKKLAMEKAQSILAVRDLPFPQTLFLTRPIPIE